MLFPLAKLNLTKLLQTTQTLPLVFSSSLLTKTLSTTTNNAPENDAVSNTNTKKTKDDYYFAAIHHVSNIVRRDFYLERTLNKLGLRVTSELVFRVLRACSSAPTESHRFFNWALAQPNYKPTSLEFEELIKILARSRKYQTMWDLLHRMNKSQSLSLSPETVSFLIEQYGKHGLVDQAVEIFNKSSKTLNCPQTLDIHNSLLFSLCQAKLFHGAYALIRRMLRKNLVPNKRTYAVLVDAWCSSGKLREAQEFLAEMSRKGLNPPVRGRDLLIEGLLNAGYLEAAKDMARNMAKQGFLPDLQTFNSLIESISKSSADGEVDFCIDLYNSVCTLGLSPDINTYKIMIPAVSKAGKVDEAFRLLNDSVERGYRPFPGLYAPVMKAMCRNGQFDDVFCFFSDMKVKGHPPNRPVYTMLITMCGRGGRFVEAANYLVEMTEFGLTPISRCFDLVTDGLKNCGKHDLARRIEQLEVDIRGV
jgi:pentatricopeptide repeat protein|uniref:Pentacotripeptide-repeat region of PRORP domain-containing protein n=1 Tax=Fagus sylvatica TaxID=28930 RepID=A0A2N9GKB8_FAGSY